MHKRSKMAFIGRDIHIKSSSDLFLTTLLMETFELFVFRTGQLTTGQIINQIRLEKISTVVFFQVPPSPTKCLSGLRGLNLYWVPMYDGFKKLTLRQRIIFRMLNFKIINFSKILNEYFQSFGFSTFYIKYFRKPLDIDLYNKNCNSGFFWHRKKGISIAQACQIFSQLKITSLILKSDTSLKDDEEHLLRESGIPYTLYAGWLTDKEIAKIYESSEYFLTPRKQEGIGLSFLDSLAHNCIPIGYDDATFNEYIENGINGYIVNDKMRIMPVENKRLVQDNVNKLAHKGFTEYTERSKYLIQFIC